MAASAPRRSAYSRLPRSLTVVFIPTLQISPTIPPPPPVPFPFSNSSTCGQARGCPHDKATAPCPVSFAPGIYCEWTASAHEPACGPPRLPFVGVPLPRIKLRWAGANNARDTMRLNPRTSDPTNHQRPPAPSSACQPRRCDDGLQTNYHHCSNVQFRRRVLRLLADLRRAPSAACSYRTGDTGRDMRDAAGVRTDCVGLSAYPHCRYPPSKWRS